MEREKEKKIRRRTGKQEPNKTDDLSKSHTTITSGSSAVLSCSDTKQGN